MKSLDYETLASLPLFMGMDGTSLSTFYEVARPVVFGVRPGAVIATAGSECRMLTFLVEGEIMVSSNDSKGVCALDEFVVGNGIIEPHRLFGLHNTFMRTYTACSSCKMLKIPKSIVVSQLLASEVFRFNLMNVICSSAQQFESRFARTGSCTLENRLATYIGFRSLRPVGRKVLHVKMTDLADILATSRLTLSHTLHALVERGLLQMYRSSIVIPSFESFVKEIK